MSLVPLPQADFFDQVAPLEGDPEKFQSLYPSPFLTASLPSFLMWQDEFLYAETSLGKNLFILALYGKYVYLPTPPRPFTKQSLGEAFAYMKAVNGPGKGVSRVEGLSEAQAQEAQGWGYPARRTLEEYLYDQSKLAALAGDPYRAKRAEVNHLVKHQALVFRPYRRTDLASCGELFELWKTQRLPALKGGIGEKMLLASQKAHLRALTQGEAWGLKAWVVLLGGRLAAYTAGTPLDPSTFGVCLEVADLTVKGLSAYIFQNLCRQMESYAFINTGDAEGLPRLAESKDHWHPIRKLPVFALDPA
ncbi:MAG TPA: phosphatidylglycerol lysyltransferase domain-containing protein [bacterium]|nr:phosphatidylglycerol lysyltransferase domain-containing protein [bacterium]